MYSGFLTYLSMCYDDNQCTNIYQEASVFLFTGLKGGAGIACTGAANHWD